MIKYVLTVWNRMVLIKLEKAAIINIFKLRIDQRLNSR